MEPHRVLFITRKYPPQTGGMESFSFNLLRFYAGEKVLLTYGGKQIFLPFVCIYFFCSAIFHILFSKVSIIHLGDGVLTPLGWAIKICTGKPVVFTAHGKDISFGNKFYQSVMPFFFVRMEHAYAVSGNTLEECVKAGMDRERCSLIPNGVDSKVFVMKPDPESLREELSIKYGLNCGDKKILLTTGRLTARKGMKWFINHVVPLLGENYIYVLAGPDGTEISDFGSLLGLKKSSLRESIVKDVERLNLERFVKLLGEIPFADMISLLNIASVFVMPNIRVGGGDIEGFGIVAIEAAACGTPVVASRLEGISDAVIDGQTGILVDAEGIEGFRSTIRKSSTLDRAKVRDACLESFSWENIASKYQREFTRVLES